MFSVRITSFLIICTSFLAISVVAQDPGEQLSDSESPFTLWTHFRGKHLCHSCQPGKGFRCREFSCGGLAVQSQINSYIPELLVSTEWLSENLGDDTMVILHYGKISEFEEGHIPGARLISSKDFMVDNQSGLRHELPDDQGLEQTLRTWGINNNSRNKL